MAKVAVPDPLSSNYFPLGKGSTRTQADATMKRKTPSELRGEQLKRRSCKRPDESSNPLLGSDGTAIGNVHGLKTSKTPKYIDTRVDEVFQVKKSSDMFRLLSAKEKAKGTVSSYEQIDKPKNPSVACNMSANSKPQPSCKRDGAPESSNCPISTTNDDPEGSYRKMESCQNTFRSVAEISLGSEALSGSAIINMDKALKGLGARDLPSFSRLPVDASRLLCDPSSTPSGGFCSEVCIPGRKVPIDLTLKTSMRLVLSSSVSWCHRLNTSSAFSSISWFASQFGYALDQNVHNLQGHTPAAQVLFSNALQSWAYPQSSLPPSVISAMTLSAARGETDFLLKRQQAWEDSLRSLYYLLRKNMCDIFYFYTSQFVVMFIGGEFLGESKRSCNAYLSQSTRGLRSLLREHDICFSMPLFHFEVEQATAEDLVELSEIEKCNLGQARRSDSMSDVDNSSKSLLAFIGSEAVHGLYDFLINYRSFYSSLTGIDVPVLYSPVPFQNASICIPEVRCKEVKRANAVHPLGEFPKENGAIQDSSSVCYSIEIKGAILPPWITYGVCTAMGSDGKSYEASFSTDHTSAGLNVALAAISQKSSDSDVDSSHGFPGSGNAFGIVGASVSPCLQSASLRSLKYSNGSFVADLSPV